MADEKVIEHYQVVAQIAATLWAAQGGMKGQPKQLDLDRMSVVAWDIYTSAIRAAAAGWERHRALMP